MTVTSISGLLMHSGTPTSTPGYTQFVLDAAGEKLAFVLQAPKTGSIRKVGFRVGNVVTSATDTDVRIESVDATTGHPSGSLLATDTNVTVSSASITTDTWITTGALTADAAVTKGGVIAVVIAPSGTPNFRLTAASNMPVMGFAYCDHYTTSYTKSSGSVRPVVALEYSDGSYAYTPGTIPASSMTTSTIRTGSTPDEIALKFKVAAPVRVGGFVLASTTTQDLDVILYDSDGTTSLATYSIDDDVSINTVMGTYLFASSVQLTADTFYYLAMKPSVDTNQNVYYFDVASAAILDSMTGGQNWHYAERTNAGGWSATTTRRPWFGLIIDGVDDGAGSGGGAGPLIGGRLVG